MNSATSGFIFHIACTQILSFNLRVSALLRFPYILNYLKYKDILSSIEFNLLNLQFLNLIRLGMNLHQNIYFLLLLWVTRYIETCACYCSEVCFLCFPLSQRARLDTASACLRVFHTTIIICGLGVE